jgi:hypothetical protein
LLGKRWGLEMLKKNGHPTALNDLGHAAQAFHNAPQARFQCLSGRQRLPSLRKALQ